MRLKRPGSGHRDFLLVQVDVRIQSSTILVLVAPADKGWPFEIENYSDYTLTITQKVTLSLSVNIALTMFWVRNWMISLVLRAKIGLILFMLARPWSMHGIFQQLETRNYS